MARMYHQIEETPSGPVRKCSKCEVTKPHSLEVFAVSHGKPGAHCKDCETKRSTTKSRKRYHETQSVASGGNEGWAKNRLDYYHSQVGQEAYRRRLLSRFGLTPEDYIQLLESQEGVCAICKSPEPRGRGKHFNVDHDHLTGEVRGLLCHGCNTSLGGFKDDPELLRAAIRYLSRGCK